MFKGFYNLTSGMVTQQRNLNVVGNNLVNLSTAGFKEERYTATTFDDVMYSRVGNKVKDYVDIGRQSYIRATSEIYTTFDQGVPEPTNLALDFAVYGDGFFAVQADEGGIFYTRSGSFTLDNEGYLCYPALGRVLDPNGQTIYMGTAQTEVGTDQIEADSQGRIFTLAGEYLGQVGVYAFEDNGALQRNAQGMFTGDGAQAVENPLVYWKYLERSNVDMVRQMTELLTCQRALQSAAEVTRMYDDVMNKAANNLGQM